MRARKQSQRVDIYLRRGRSLWRYGRWLGGIVLAVIGLAGIPDELAIWQRWIAEMMADPRVHALAVRITGLAHFIDQTWFRVLLMLVALLLLSWGITPLRQWRRHFLFSLRHAMESQVWINAANALDLVMNSSWAKARKARKAPPGGRFENFFAVGIDNPARDSRNAMFQHWCQEALKHFKDANSKSHREVGNKDEYDEVSLKEWLVERYRDDLETEFGQP
jgi:hypothetical protein